MMRNTAALRRFTFLKSCQASVRSRLPIIGLAKTTALFSVFTAMSEVGITAGA